MLGGQGEPLDAREAGGFGVMTRWRLGTRISAVVLGLLTGLALMAYLTGAPGRYGRLGASMLTTPAATLPTVVVAALVDSINPCAFTLLLIFIASVTAFLQTTQGKSLQETRAVLYRYGARSTG